MRARTDSGKLKKAYQNYETLRQAGAVSRPVSERHVGIIIGRGFTYIAAEGECDETENFVHEATVLANRIRLVGYEATVGLCETKEAMGELCNNPAITDLLFVGNGNICGIEVDRKPSLRIDTTLTPRPRTTPVVFDWWDLACSLDHLKQGRIVQRTCALFRRDLNVALGTFGVTDQRQVYAVVGHDLNVPNLKHPGAEGFEAVYPEEHLSLQAIEALARRKQTDFQAEPGESGQVIS